MQCDEDPHEERGVCCIEKEKNNESDCASEAHDYSAEGAVFASSATLALAPRATYDAFRMEKTRVWFWEILHIIHRTAVKPNAG